MSEIYSKKSFKKFKNLILMKENNFQL